MFPPLAATSPEVHALQSMGDDVAARARELEQPHGLQDNPENTVNDSFVNLSLVCLNVCGLKSKMSMIEFTNSCTDHDIVILGETKCDDTDVPVVENYFSALQYNVFMQNRESLAKHRSGGVLIAMKDHVAKHFIRVNYCHNFLVVLKSVENVVGFEKKLVLIAVYIPPYGSKYSSVDMFQTLSDVILDFDSSEYAVIVCGDMNAHSLLKEDTVEFDNAFQENVPLDYFAENELCTTQVMRELNLPVKRANSDTKPDSSGYGEALVDLCRNHSLCIFNGRAGADNGIGKPTTTDHSLIDYVIGSPITLASIASFHVADFDALLSDKHCPVYFTLKSNLLLNNNTPTMAQLLHMENDNGQNPPAETLPRKWNGACAHEFVASINPDQVNSILLEMDGLSINEITKQIRSIMIDAAVMAMGAKQRCSNKSLQPPIQANTVPMTKQLRELRKAYFKAKKLNWRLKTPETRQKLAESSLAYKNEIKKATRLKNKEFLTNLRGSKKNNPKMYWNMLQDSAPRSVSIPLNEFHDYFKNLSCHEDTAPETTVDMTDLQHAVFNTESLNAPFTEQEIASRIRLLKNGKAAGNDSITNEFLKHSVGQLMPLYLKLFNRIMQEGSVPEEWLVGMILPLYKNKGDRADPNNYRGITLLSCFGKLFTAVLNDRLYKFCEDNDILKELQGGFRQGYSTTDHIFLVQSLISMFIHNKKKLYACFVDYAKAFDTISRSALWSKLLQCGIHGKILNVIKNMYTDIKSCVYSNGNKSEYFTSLRGVRQGENLSPLLFSLFVNDLEDFLLKKGCQPIESGSPELDNFLKLLLVMYADDTILMSNSELGLQKAIDALHDYCNKWQLTVNCDKTNVVIFSRRKVDASKYNFTYNGKNLEITSDFKYLGLRLKHNGTCTLGVRELCKQASRAMFALISKCRKFDLPVDLQLELFDSLVVPILTYNCEVWGHTNIDPIEKLHLKFLKYVLRVKTSTCNSMVYGELGRYPLSVRVKKQMVAFWAKTLYCKSSKLSAITLNTMFAMHQEGHYSSPWLLNVKRTLDQCGLSYIWDNQSFPSHEWLKRKVEQVLKDQFFQEWRVDLASKTSCDVYEQMKDSIKLESYLLMGNKSMRKSICQIRTNNSQIPKVTGRYKNIPRGERYCKLCDGNKLGDEFHLIVECLNENIVQSRKKYVPRHVTHRPSFYKCIDWLKSSSKANNKALGNFLKDVLPLYK